jgi:3-isopropylmalate/(R)-2-methylmalate dehydratase small subunit
LPGISRRPPIWELEHGTREDRDGAGRTARAFRCRHRPDHPEPEWRDDPGFVLNDPDHAGATILVAGPNFGTGSSREHAVWALVDYGFHAVISPRFGDIFRNNSTRSGLVPAEVSEQDALAIMGAVKADPALELIVDVERRLVEAAAAGISVPFRLDDDARDRLLKGLDDIGVTTQYAADIDSYEARRQAWLPKVSA